MRKPFVTIKKAAATVAPSQTAPGTASDGEGAGKNPLQMLLKHAF
jgi:hypothetical protein